MNGRSEIAVKIVVVVTLVPLVEPVIVVAAAISLIVRVASRRW